MRNRTLEQQLAAGAEPALRQLVEGGAVTPAAVEQMRRVFAAADRDGSGELDR